MCGIYCILNSTHHNSKQLAARGPDEYKTYTDAFVHMDFYRLAINGLTNGSQPMFYKNYVLICNGEIYNHKHLEASAAYSPLTQSDCECILPYFHSFGIAKTCQAIDGVFAFVIWDIANKILYVGRDRFGVRPLFYSQTGNVVQFSSEVKGMVLESHSILRFPPGCRGIVHDNKIAINEYFYYRWNDVRDTKEPVLNSIHMTLNKAVKKRMMTDRPVGCLLSGGLDSSLITALVRKYLPAHIPLKTFSIGFAGSPDLKYARIVADFLKTEHHEFIVEPSEFLEAIDEVIRVTESYDITTIRASVGNYLVCKKIVGSTVIFNGDGADEVCGGYLYHQNAPTLADFHQESVNLLKEIHAFDGLRSDRCCSGHGLEPRTPFLDRDFVNYYMSIPIELRFDKSRQEKYLLREAFVGYLPPEVLWRKKEAFSDGVSVKEKSWWQIIQEHLGDEKKYYYDKFVEYYGTQVDAIPRYWMPKWSGNITNPSARVLTTYE